MWCKTRIIVSMALVCMASHSLAQTKSVKSKPVMTTSEVLSAAKPDEWRAFNSDDLVVLHLKDGDMVMALASEFSPEHVANIKSMVRSGYFDGSALVRVQDNYVVQWARPEEAPKKDKGVTVPKDNEYEFALKGHTFTALGFADAYAKRAGFVHSWPVATDNKQAWLVHCYGMIGVGRDNPPDNGDGSELYSVIGHAPRHLDRNIALVGRVISGIDLMSSKPRGGEAMGFYKTKDERAEIIKAEMVADMAEAKRPHFEILDSRSKSFQAWLKARADRSDPWFYKPVHGLDLCNALPPVKAF